MVVRQFPLADPAAAHEQQVLRTLDGLGGVAPVLLGGDLNGQWSNCPTSLISWLDGQADITPADPEQWAHELGRTLALVHAVPSDRLADLPSVFDARGSEAELNGPLAAEVRSRWSQIIGSPDVLTHSDYWSGNVVWRDGKLTGIVDWSGGARGPRGYDLGWCRLDLVLLFDEPIADAFLRPMKQRPVRPLATWFCATAGRSLGRTALSRRGFRTTRRWGAPTSTRMNFGDAIHGGPNVSESARRLARPAALSHHTLGLLGSHDCDRQPELLDAVRQVPAQPV